MTFEDLSQSLTKELQPQLPSDPLYHYTSSKGLWGIVNTQKIWSSHHTFFNDPSEPRYAFDLVYEQSHRNRERDDIWAESVKSFKRLGQFSQHSSVDVFATSFSQEADQLGQWRAYAANGKGISIPFLAKELLETADETIALNSAVGPQPPKTLGPGDFESKAYFVRLNYDSNSHHRKVRSMLEHWHKATTEQLNSSRNSRQQELNNSMAWLQHYTTLLNLSFKHSAYKEENEWRLIICYPMPELQRNRHKIKTRVVGDSIVPYYPVSLVRSALIKEVICGPACNFTKAKVALKYMNIEAKQSSIPYIS